MNYLSLQPWKNVIASSSIDSDRIHVGDATSVSLQISGALSGASYPYGTLSLQVANIGKDIFALTQSVAWTTVASSSVAISGSAVAGSGEPVFYDLPTVTAEYLRIKFVATAGSKGTLSAVVHKKQ